MSDPLPLGLVLRAASFAATKHKDQRRKGNAVPYVNHPLSVCRRLAETAGVEDPITLSAALLHDTIEDTDTTADELRGLFGDAITDVVLEVTDDKSLRAAERKQAQIAHASHLSPRARLVKLADKLDNLTDLGNEPPPQWPTERVRGYFIWAYAVIHAIPDPEPRLFASLQAVLEPQVPTDAAERATLLTEYYDLLG